MNTSTNIPKRDSRPTRLGWSPGDYLNVCFECSANFYSDPSAVVCADCAYGEPPTAAQPAMNLNELARVIHAANIKWWQDVNTGEPIKRNKGEMIALMHSELSEMLEGERKNLMDDHLPHRRMAEVELADELIRILDYAGGFGYDLQGAFDEKLAYNARREDHSHEARRIAGGKQF